MDDTWTEVPELFSSIFTQSQSQIVKEQRQKLRSIGPELQPPLDLEKELFEISLNLSSGKINSFVIEDLRFEGIFLLKIENRQLKQFKASCITMVCAEKLIAAGEVEAAWPLLCHTNYLIGIIEDGVSLAARALEQSEKTILSKPARQKGGAATKEKYDKIRDLMVELLSTRAPVGGWKTKAEAIDTIIEDLQEFATEATLNLPLPDIHATATNWLKKSGNREINDAYLRSAIIKS